MWKKKTIKTKRHNTSDVIIHLNNKRSDTKLRETAFLVKIGEWIYELVNELVKLVNGKNGGYLK